MLMRVRPCLQKEEKKIPERCSILPRKLIWFSASNLIGKIKKYEFDYVCVSV